LTAGVSLAATAATFFWVGIVAVGAAMLGKLISRLRSESGFRKEIRSKRRKKR